jgi:ribulose-phosphate 3-epimerase
MKISASVYSTKVKDLPSLVHDLDELNVDALHIDCFDEDIRKVEKDLNAIRQFSKTAIDLHAITANPHKYISLAADFSINYLTFQYENLKDKHLSFPDRKFKLGISLVSDTPLDSINGISKEIDFILLMTTEPGKSGGVFDRKNFNKIAECKRRFPHLSVHVDGGINAEIAFILRLMGVDTAVSGSFLVNHDNLAKALADLRFNYTASFIKVKEYMLEKSLLPLVDFQNAGFEEVIKTIHQYRMGFALIEKDGRLFGLTSNADLRKGIISKMNDIQGIRLEDIVNQSPVVIDENFTTGDMLQLIDKTPFPVHFLPVVNNEREVRGCILFNQLMKG